MLDASQAPQRLAGLTIFEDHADPSVRYVMTDVPTVVSEPEPQVGLVLYRGEDQQGGLLSVHTQLAPTEAQLQVVRDALTSRAVGRPVLHRLDWRSGRVRLAGWLQEEDALQPLSLELGRPSLLGDPSSLISAQLDRNAATLAERSLRGGGLPTSVFYELDVLGLQGPLGVEVEADLQAMHDRLTAGGALTTPYGAAKLSATWEEFLRDRLIRITVLDQSADPQSQQAEAMWRLGQELVMTMFSTMPPPEAPTTLTDEAIAAIELSFRLTMRREELATTAKWSYLERTARTMRHYAATSLVSLLGDRSPDEHITLVDLGAPSQRQITVRTGADLAALGIAVLTVDLRIGDGETIREEGVSLEPETLEVVLPIEEDAPPIQYGVRARFDPEITSAPEQESEWLDATGTMVWVDPTALFPARTHVLVAEGTEWDWIDHVEVVLRAGEQPPRSYVLTAERRLVDAFLPGAGDEPLAVTVHHRGVEGEPSLSAAPREVAADENVVFLASPFDPSIHVTVVPLPLPGVFTLDVELQGDDDALPQSHLASWSDGGRDPARVSLRRLRGGSDGYRYRTTIVREDGALEVSDWQSSESRTLVVGADGPRLVHRHRLVVLGGGPRGRGVAAIEVVLEASEHRARAVLEGAEDEVTLTIVTPEDAPTPILTVREVSADDTTVETVFANPAPFEILTLAAAPQPPQ